MNAMSTSTLVSVIVAAHNEERYLGRCLRSLLAQRFERNRYDVIVIDDASTDRTSAVLATFGDSITVLRNETNLGLPASLNRAKRCLNSTKATTTITWCAWTAAGLRSFLMPKLSRCKTMWLRPKAFKLPTTP